MTTRTSHWRMLLRTKSEAKALLMAGPIRETIGDEMVPTLSETDATLYEVAFDVPVEAADVQAAVFETLKLAQKLAVEWSVKGPLESPDGSVAIEGLADEQRTTIRAPGVVKAHFQLVWTP